MVLNFYFSTEILQWSSYTVWKAMLYDQGFRDNQNLGNPVWSWYGTKPNYYWYKSLSEL